LVVDDDQGVTDTFSRMLRLEGFVVNTARSGEMGLEQVAADPPDAIILDWRMPLMDGLQFLRRLRATDRQRTTPVAIVTGEWTLDDATTAELRALGVHVRFKPLWQEELADLARRLVKVTH
jgi:DNA-binding response OmpR family regulator